MNNDQHTAQYQLTGQDAPAEAVVLLHGELATAEFWETTANELAPHYRVVRPMRQNHSNLDQQALELLGLLDSLEINEYHLVGHSGGGLLALRAAAERPERCQTLTLADSLACIDAQLEHKINSIAQALEAGGPRLAALVALPWLWGASSFENPERLEASIARAERADPAQIRTALQGVLAIGDQRKWLRALECPTLVAVGSDDALTPLRYSHELVEWVKPGLGVLVTITGGGHNAPLEQPEEFNRILLGFLARHKEFVAGPSEWQDDDGAEMHDYGDLESLR